MPRISFPGRYFRLHRGVRRDRCPPHGPSRFHRFMAFFLLLIVSGSSPPSRSCSAPTKPNTCSAHGIRPRPLHKPFVDITVYSSWAVLVMALRSSSHMPVRGGSASSNTPCGVFVLPPFVLTASALGTMLALAATTLSGESASGGSSPPEPWYLRYRLRLCRSFAAERSPDSIHRRFSVAESFRQQFSPQFTPIHPELLLVQSLAALAAHETRTFVLTRRHSSRPPCSSAHSSPFSARARFSPRGSYHRKV